MSGITPLLDSLLHQVLGRSVDLPVARQGARPLEPVVPGGAARALHGDSRPDARGPQLLSPLPQAAPRGDGEASRPVSPEGAASLASTSTRLSPAARTIADVLVGHPGRPSAITPAAPLLSSVGAPPVASLLASLLGRSIGESGLFYEAHLARWYRGELPLQALLREPQMSGWLPSAGEAASSLRAGSVSPVAAMPVLAEAAEGESLSIESSVRTEEAPQSGAALPREQLQGLVRHQLELLVNPLLRWEGQAWPGLFMSLLIQAPETERGDSARSDRDREAAVQEEAQWCLRLELELPVHGTLRVEAWLGAGSLSLSMFSASPALLEYFSRTQGLLRERIGQCCPGELALRCLDARLVAERSDE